MKDTTKWLMDAALRHVAPRLALAALVALAGILADAGLLGGEVVDALQALAR